MRENALKRGFTGRCRASWCIWGLWDGPSLPTYGQGHLWAFSGLSVLTQLSVFRHPFFLPLLLLSQPFSPLSVDFSTSKTKQTQSCVSSLVTLRALPDRRSCWVVCPPCSTFSTFLRQALMPFPCSELTLRPRGTAAKQHVFTRETCLFKTFFIFNWFISNI